MSLRKFGVVFAGLIIFLVSVAPLPARQGGSPSASLFADMKWRPIGPLRGGRTKAAAGVASQPFTFYMGMVNGGVWKTTNAGRTWVPIFDDQPTGSIGAIGVSQSDPNIIYVGSGEGLQRPDLAIGDGIYKSTDAGKTWTHLGLRDTQQIPHVEVDPKDPNRIFVAALGHPYGPNEERGIFRSLDGGKTFEKVLYKGPTVCGKDVDIDPVNPNIVYATMWEAQQGPWENGAWTGNGGGVFKSTDGGTTWKQLTNGLPANLVTAEMTIAPSNPKRLYARVAVGGGPSTGSGRGGRGADQGAGPRYAPFYRSDDAGETWAPTTTDTRVGTSDEAIIVVDPKDPDWLIVTSQVTAKSTDGGKTWVPFKGAPGGDDYQNGWINPNMTDVMILVADQGAAVSLDKGVSWSSWYNQPTAAMYHVMTDNAFPYSVCGGQQDSGSACVQSRGNDGAITFREWHPAAVEEYGYATPDPLDANIIYGGKVSRYDKRTGQVSQVGPLAGRGGAAFAPGGATASQGPEVSRTVRTQPVVFSQVDKHALFYATNVLWKTTDEGVHWKQISPDLTRKTHDIPPSIASNYREQAKAQVDANGARVIYTIGPSYVDINRIWAGTDDGVIQTTADGGLHWTDVTPKEMTSYEKVFTIDPGRFDPLTAYAAVNTLRLDDQNPHIFRTHDGGKTWKEIVNGLPGGNAVSVVREDSKKKGLLFAGSETQVYVSFDDGDHWESLRLNMAPSSVRDMVIKDDDLVAGTHGRGIWILDDITPLRQISASAGAMDMLFKPAPGLRVRWNTNPDTPLPPDEPRMPNPPDGAAIDYYLAGDTAGPVTIEVWQGAKLVRRYSSADVVPELPDPATNAPLPLYWYRAPQHVSTKAGMHRFIWDVHYQPLAPVPGPSTGSGRGGAGRGGRGGAAFAPGGASASQAPVIGSLAMQAVPYYTVPAPSSPWVAPGEYTVKLTVNGKSYTQPMTVKQDPRVKTPAVVMQQVYTTTTATYYEAIAAGDAARAAQAMRDRIAKLVAGGNTDKSLADFDKKLADLNLGAAANGLGGAMNQLQSADVTPTEVQLKAIAAARLNASTAMAKWAALKAATPAILR